ncbi:hypothetical protein BJY52DRAFT_1186997 [Lactarius psammicola]|nr:hypothetical protein BJY52DRAFT_1186997 [Lactarius psammicola]
MEIFEKPARGLKPVEIGPGLKEKGVLERTKTKALEKGPESDIDLGRDVTSQPIDPPSQAEATIIDASNQLFSMYNEATAEHDRRVAKRWERDADSAIIVNGFFSVVVAILLTRSYDGLKLNSRDASAFYLSRIYQLSAGLNSTSTPLPFEVPTPSTFSPDPPSVRASAFWSLSLVLSLAGTVVATLLRQWAWRYLHLTQEPRGPGKRARIRELTAQGVERLQLQWMSLVLPGLFHLSVLLFLYGLFHYSNNNVVDLVVLSSALICLGLYLFASIVSYFPFGSICHTPLSSFAWSWSSRVLWWTYKTLYNSSIRLRFIGVHTRLHLFESARSHLGRALRDPGVDMEDLARKRSSFLDTSVVLRVFDSLDGYQDMERFLSAIPGFYNSSWVKRDVPVLEKLNGKKLAPAITTFMDHSLSSDLLTEPEKQDCITICLGAINADPLLLQCTFRQTLQALNSSIFRCIDFVSFALQHLGSGDSDSDPWVKDYAQCIVAVAITRVQPDDDAWIDIIRRYLSPQHSQYQWGGDNIRLCNLMYLTRWLIASRLKDSDQFEQEGVWRNVLTEVRKFKVMETAPELQHEFCALWNELTFVAQDQQLASGMAQTNAARILSIIRTVYVPLHKDTDSATVAFSSSTGDQDLVLRLPSSYPFCNVLGHHPDPRPHIYDSTPATSSRTYLHDSAALTRTSFHSLDAPRAGPIAGSSMRTKHTV